MLAVDRRLTGRSIVLDKESTQVTSLAKRFKGRFIFLIYFVIIRAISKISFSLVQVLF
jgi:hypothetical protein